MSMNKKLRLAALLVLACALFSSCTLLPEEETVRTAPVIRTYQRPEYELVEVQRGDLIQTAKITCRYVPVQTVSIPFELAGEYVDRMMVQVGDIVQEGQLLGQLQLGNLEERIESCTQNIAELELRMKHLEKTYALDQRRLDITHAQADPMTRKEAADDLLENFEKQSAQLLDSLRLQNLELSELQKELSERQIHAPFAGTITYVREYKDGEQSQHGSRAVTLVDSTMSLFRTDTEHWNRFKPGDTYDILVDKELYAAVVTDEETLGIPAEEKVEGKRASVYFVLTQPAFELDDDSYGSIEITLAEHLNVLHVPSSAVSASNEQPIVYFKREDGTKGFKPVETGVTLNRRTEILSGLVEGESIILD